LANGEGNHGGFASSGLGLGDDVTALDDWRDGPLLNSRGLLEAVLVDSTEQIVLNPHLLEARNRLHTFRRLEVHIIRRIHRPSPVRRHHRRRCHRPPPHYDSVLVEESGRRQRIWEISSLCCEP